MRGLGRRPKQGLGGKAPDVPIAKRSKKKQSGSEASPDGDEHRAVLI